ncbi:hypothetical protein GQ53DRAFT_741545 [Thozetella sp. PMI_491]|nr:hypothetical protein GQ53DRAFT_741545 [Thozetella sp. PMI_491]
MVCCTSAFTLLQRQAIATKGGLELEELVAEAILAAYGISRASIRLGWAASQLTRVSDRALLTLVNTTLRDRHHLCI